MRSDFSPVREKNEGQHKLVYRPDSQLDSSDGREVPVPTLAPIRASSVANAQALVLRRQWTTQFTSGEIAGGPIRTATPSRLPTHRAQCSRHARAIAANECCGGTLERDPRRPHGAKALLDGPRTLNRLPAENFGRCIRLRVSNQNIGGARVRLPRHWQFEFSARAAADNRETAHYPESTQRGCGGCRRGDCHVVTPSHHSFLHSPVPNRAHRPRPYGPRPVAQQ